MAKQNAHRENRFINSILRKGQQRRPKLEDLYRIFIGLRQVLDNLVELDAALSEKDIRLIQELVRYYYEQGNKKIRYPKQRYPRMKEISLLFNELVSYACSRTQIDGLFHAEDADDDVIVSTLDLFLDNQNMVMFDYESRTYFESLVRNMLSVLEEELEPEY